MADETCDAFLGGALQIYQPVQGYRAGVDPVLLAASVSAREGQSVLELGCGVGVASLCLGRRVQGLHLAGIERESVYADLARRNARRNAIDFDVTCADLSDLPRTLKNRQFDHVIANPPYYLRQNGTAAMDHHREAALGEDTPLSTWIEVAAKRTAPKGYVTFIHRAERLPDLLAGFAKVLGSLELLPLIPRPGRDPQLVLLRGRRGGRAAFRLLPGVVMHDGPTHDGDRENYVPEVKDVLRHGTALQFW